MRILMLKWNGLGQEDMAAAFDRLGHRVSFHSFDTKEYVRDDLVEKEIKKTFDETNSELIFSFNFFPIVSKVCHDNGIPYFAWVYDSPQVLLYHFSLAYPTNHVFLFDYEEYCYFKNNGINTVYYMPLAADPVRISSLLNDESSLTTFKNSGYNNKCQVAFVGSLYTDNHQFFDRMTSIKPYTRGYLEGIIAVQRQLYGLNLVQNLLTDDIMDDMYSDLQMKVSQEGVETRQYLYGEYVVNRKITALERKDFLSEIAGKYKLDLYSFDKDVNISGAICHGPVDYYDMAPFVYNSAKINLNISLRSIHTGIPLRCFEIMASGGLLLSNYQQGFADCFTEGEEYVAFESKDDMMRKIDYLLAHEDERSAIAKNGYKRILSDHTYDKRIEEMLSIL